MVNAQVIKCVRQLLSLRLQLIRSTAEDVDVLDGTPLLDIKWYVRRLDSSDGSSSQAIAETMSGIGVQKWAV